MNWVGNSVSSTFFASLERCSCIILAFTISMMSRRDGSSERLTETITLEKEKRLNIFKANVEFIESSNVGNKPYKLSVNEFADQTIEEFKTSRNGYKKSWRRMAAIEGITQLATGKLTSLSEQELVDCDTKGEDQGCEGGIMDDAFEFIQETRVDGSCNTKKAETHAASINGYEDVSANNEASLLKAVSKQPVSVAIDASGQEFQFYSSGVFTGTCGIELYHGVTAVGYKNDSDGTKYWLVKNSWGTSWGEDGYIRMQRDVDDKA
ncbi:hypothetical protein MKX01_012201 [Papaver californicum]|nr:hypothetical protein MKX01_012201 [Papaver californicum]